VTTVANIRSTLAEYVHDAFIDLPDDEIGEAGNYPAVELWNPAGLNITELADAAIQPEESVKGLPRFEFVAEADVDFEAALGSGLGEHIRRATLARGVDGLAWYSSFHVRGRQWGIYLPISSIVGFAQEVFGGIGLNLSAAMRLSAHVLHQHELFHFAVDYFTFLWELATNNACWKPARELRQPIGYYEREEKLANAYMLRRINAVGKELKVRGRASRLNRFVASMPAGYRDALDFIGAREFRDECEILCIDYAESASEGPLYEEAVGPVLLELLRVDHRLDWRDCPVHVVHDERRFSLPDFYANLFLVVASIDEAPSFRKALEKCDAKVQRAWARTRQKLATTVASPGLDFKLWARRASQLEYSVRVDGNFRAHLLFDRGSESWTALSIGTHTKMGHG
jgi:hypothetical protein